MIGDRIGKLLSREVCSTNGYALPNFLSALNRHAISRTEAFLYYPKISGTLADPHRLNVDFIIRLYHRHLEAALQFRNSALGNKQRIMF